MFGNAAFAEVAYAQVLKETYVPPVIPPEPPGPSSQWVLINDSQATTWKIINDSQ